VRNADSLGFVHGFSFEPFRVGGIAFHRFFLGILLPARAQLHGVLTRPGKRFGGITRISFTCLNGQYVDSYGYALVLAAGDHMKMRRWMVIEIHLDTATVEAFNGLRGATL
jgi:hypothetical protein